MTWRTETPHDKARSMRGRAVSIDLDSYRWPRSSTHPVIAGETSLHGFNRCVGRTRPSMDQIARARHVMRSTGLCSLDNLMEG